MLIAHTDGSSGDDVSGIGYTIEDTSEQTECGKRTLFGEYTSMEAEYHALVEALRIASQRFESETCITVWSDCKPLVRKLNGSEDNSNKWQRYREGCLWLLKKFDSWSIEYLPREENKSAHELARLALKQGRAKNSDE